MLQRAMPASPPSRLQTARLGSLALALLVSPVTTQADSANKAAFEKPYRWQPFETVQRPPVPKVKNRRWVRNPIDAFIAAEHESHKLRPRPEAAREVLFRR